jgi:CheY-like chemotaxis protein
VVDSDESTRYVLETHLKRAGFNVVTSSTGDEALEKVDMSKPAAIISGLFLAKIDGLSLRKKLLEDSSYKNIPFILTSSLKNESTVIRAQSLNIFHYFKNPILLRR